MKNESLTTAVEEHYAAVARGESSACAAPVGDVARSIGYSEQDLALAGDANLGLGCGNPLALTELGPGMTVVDLGVGRGIRRISRFGSRRANRSRHWSGHDGRHARAGAAERRKARSHERRISQRIHRRPSRRERVGGLRDQQLRHQSLDRQARCVPRNRANPKARRKIRSERHCVAQAIAGDTRARHQCLRRLHIRCKHADRISKHRARCRTPRSRPSRASRMAPTW